MRPFSQEHCGGKHVGLRVFQSQSRFNDLDDWHFSDIVAPIGGVGNELSRAASSPPRSIELSSETGSFRWSRWSRRAARLRSRWRASSAASNPSVSARQGPPP
jgi:hypothetical protein